MMRWVLRLHFIVNIQTVLKEELADHSVLLKQYNDRLADQQTKALENKPLEKVVIK